MRTISEKERFFINIARGVAVFLMLWGHCIQYLTAESGLDFFENSVFKFIYSFHMPLFMILSGYLFFYSFQKRDLKELLIHRVQSLAFPIVFGSIFIWLTTDVFFAVINGNYGVIFDGGWIYKLPSLWFLWSVLVSSIMVAICVKKITNVWGQIACLVLSSGAIVFFPNAMLNLYMYPYFVIGFCFAKCREKMPTWMIRCRYLSILAFPFLLFFYEKKHYIYTTGLFGNGYSLVDAIIIDLYRWLIGFTGSVFVMVVL